MEPVLSSRGPSAKKYLTLVSPDLPSLTYDEAKRLEDEDKIPRRAVTEEALATEIFDSTWFTQSRNRRKIAYRVLPVRIAQVVEAFRIRKHYRVIISWSEFAAIMLALLFKFTRNRTPHVALLYWMSPKKKALMLRHVQTHIDKIITWSSVQMAFAIRELHVPAEKIVLVRHFVDVKFWRPMAGQRDMICSAGREMRDYPTLVEAMRGLPIRCHIATGDIRGYMEPTVKAIYAGGALPPNVTVEKLAPAALRDLYARSRFAVVPLQQSDTDNGVNVILEAMAMGKAVICSRTIGQVDVIQEGITGIFVPAGDPAALRRAIETLWNDPERAERMGSAARGYVEELHSLDTFLGSVRRVVEGVATSCNA